MHRPVHELLESVSGRLSLHMPGAQGKAPFEPMDPYRVETTELPVTDDLYKPAGAIAKAQELLADSAHTHASFLLTGGSTAGIHAMILYACNRGDAIILPRNVHLSVLNICAIAGIEPVFAAVSQTPEGFVTAGPQAYQEALNTCPNAAAVLAVSTDYYGLLSDVKAIADLAHTHGKPLLCDEAHGAHFNWQYGMQNAGSQGADLFVQSAHKTLPAYNPAAWLHAMRGIDTARLQAILRMVQTSSPPFTLLQAMDDARAWMDMNGAQACRNLREALDEFRTQAAALGYSDDRKPYPHDPLRLVLHAPQGGKRLENSLRDAGIDVEMSDENHIVCILSLMDGRERLQTLLTALRRIPADAQATQAAGLPLQLTLVQQPMRAMPLATAAFAQAELVPVKDAAGRISAQHIGVYPPGIAWITAGEIITDELIARIGQTPAHRLFDVSGGIRCVQ